MPIDYKKNLARLRDIVSVEDAEGLLDWLQNRPSAKIDLADCSHLHPASLQVLMAAQCRVATWPADTSLHGWLASALHNK